MDAGVLDFYQVLLGGMQCLHNLSSTLQKTNHCPESSHLRRWAAVGFEIRPNTLKRACILCRIAKQFGSVSQNLEHILHLKTLDGALVNWTYAL